MKGIFTPAQERETGRTGPADRRVRPQVERFESRELMTVGPFAGATGFITGTVLLENTGKGQAGATIEVYKPNTDSPIATTVTDTYGNYTIRNLKPGDYLVKQIAPAGSTNSYANPKTQLNKAQSVAIDTIQVTVVDPSSVYFNSNGAVAASSAQLNDRVSLLYRTTVTAGLYNASLGTDPGATDINAGFKTILVGARQSLSASGGEYFAALPRTGNEMLSSLSLRIGDDRAGRVGYLFNKYASASLDKVQGAALQVAIWELVNDGSANPDFKNGLFQVVGPAGSTSVADTTAILAAASGFYKESEGRREPVTFLDPNPGLLNLGMSPRSILVGNSLNFVNKVAFNVTPSDNVNLPITNIQYYVNGVAVGSSLEGNIKGGDSVEVAFTIPKGKGRFTLVAYTANPQFDLSSQYVIAFNTRLLSAGDYKLKVTLPNENVQVYFVHGSPINSLDLDKGRDYFTTNQYIDSAVGFKVV